MRKVVILAISITLNIFFIFKLYAPGKENQEFSENQSENQISNFMNCKTLAKIKKEINYSSVYILPHPPDFPEGKEILVEKFEKKSGFWELIEVKRDGSKVKLQIRDDSIEWR